MRFEETLILGHQGFLDYFTATFKGDEFALELEANSYLSEVAIPPARPSS